MIDDTSFRTFQSYFTYYYVLLPTKFSVFSMYSSLERGACSCSSPSFPTTLSHRESVVGESGASHFEFRLYVLCLEKYTCGVRLHTSDTCTMVVLLLLLLLGA